MIVMKFGGSSVESKEAVERVTGIVKGYQARRPIVVVSAMGKTTNKLLQAAHEAAAGRRDQALTIIDELRGQHLMHGLGWQALFRRIWIATFARTSNGWMSW